MSKFYGPIGFATTIESAPDVYIEKLVEKNTMVTSLKIIES